MGRQSKREDPQLMYVRHRQNDRVEKQRILEEFMHVYGDLRNKYVSELLNRSLPKL